jgi:hypothetical protein
MLRTLETVFPKKMIEVFYGKYHWTDNPKTTYKQYMKTAMTTIGAQEKLAN